MKRSTKHQTKQHLLTNHSNPSLQHLTYPDSCQPESGVAYSEQYGNSQSTNDDSKQRLSQFEFITVVGKGAFGKVFKVSEMS